ncbi:hypothetical protein SSX86_014079 [Deinandra increscens subsp. villosa]|uniref:Uncharacterized protein n=1 Tax=Deinandra increscens subsp. villosa TaxID=3103831 RepID=A0AAP0D2V9_9ASTR
MSRLSSSNATIPQGESENMASMFRATSYNCQKLKRLALCGSETVGDAEISCIAEECTALKKLSSPVSDHGIEALAGGCPNLVKVKVKKCRGVTGDGAGWLRASRESLAVNLDTAEIESQDAASDGV